MNALLAAAVLALPPLMPVDQIAPGQKGSCITVFEGAEIEPFEFVVKGVMENFLGPGKDVVLVRLLGEKPEHTGVVAGMSGSPCSIDGKLVGALAYAFAAFAKEPIAGITPMKDMLEVMRQPKETRPWRLAAADPSITSDAWDSLRAGRAPAPHAASDGMRPIAAPLSLGGIIPKVRQHFTPWLQAEGFLPVAGGSSGARGAKPRTIRDVPTKLEPGSAIAAVLVTGDVSIAATGTVTSVEGDEVLAFGHPFLGTGILSVPMATATIVNTMVSQMRSFKMSIPGVLVGEVTQDRLTAIGGLLGPVPGMIPVTGSIQTKVGAQSFAFEVARDQSLSPRFAAMGLANALYGSVPAVGRGTLRMKGTVKAKGLEPIEVRSVNASQRDDNLLIYPAIDIARTVATLWDTPFGAPPDLELAFEAELDPEPVVEWIESMHVDRGIARPGEEIDVSVRLRREDGPIRYERFTLQIPRSWAGKKVELIACSGSLAQQVADSVGGKPRPTELSQIGRWLSERRLDGHLYLLATREGAGMRSNVKTLSFLPGSAVAIQSGDPNKQRNTRGMAWEERRAQPGSLVGGVKSSIKVLSY